VSGWTPPRRM